jgi:sigma-B regulation protein RsbU (phosphoserine phosphatase)
MPADAARLLVHEPSGNEREVPIEAVTFTLGRHADNHLVLLDSRISRRHARMVRTPQGYVLEDCGSRHGTFVNGQRITSQLLASGDRISLGTSDGYRLTFLAEGAALPQLLDEMGKAVQSRVPQLQHLSLLLRMAEMLHRAPGLEEVLRTLVDSALQLADADRGLLFLANAAGELKLRLARTRSGTSLPLKGLVYSKPIVDRVVAHRQEEIALADEEASGMPLSSTGLVTPRMRGVVAVPLQKLPMMEITGETVRMATPQLLGVLYLEGTLRAHTVTGLDRQVLQSLAVEGATVIENARLFHLAREQERTRHELNLASTIQQGLLPKKLPQIDAFEFEALTTPCSTIGGDYYDIIPLPGGRYGLAVADVSGKGLPAAMMAMTLQGAFAAVAAGDPPLPELFARVNTLLYERTPNEMYATFFYGVLSISGEVTFVNAGHVPPLVLRSHGIEHLHDGSLPLGMFEHAPFEVAHTRLDPGDQLVVFSDGVTEARNNSGDLFGEERLELLLHQFADASPTEVCRKIVAAVEEFADEGPQADDLTILAVRYRPARR